MRFFRFLAFAFLLLPSTSVLFAFNGHVVTEGPLTLTIDPIPVVTAFDAPQPCRVTLANSSSAPLDVTVELTGLVDDCHGSGEVRQQVTVPAAGKIPATFQFACGAGTHSGVHYPVHVLAAFATEGNRRIAQAVQIFQTDFPRAPTAALTELPVLQVSGSGGFALAALNQQRITWSYVGEAPAQEPIGWTGTDATSAAHFQRGPVTRGGVSRATLQLHPPYRPRAGTVFAEYRVQLPGTGPISLEFFNAIRDSAPREGTSDGVTFRVWADDEMLFERHTDSKTWTPGSADLSRFAGRTISLRFESHPGPRNNTSCDSSYWGDPVITAGARPAMLDEKGRSLLLDRARAAVRSGQSAEPTTLYFRLTGGMSASVVIGPSGLVDGAIAFGNQERQVAFGGLHMAVRENLLGVWPSGATVKSVQLLRDGTAGPMKIMHRLEIGDQTATFVATVWADGPALRVKVECPEFITSLGLNPADQRAGRVFYGHGYCIVDPKPFRARANGHDLATSHVGFDFEQGVSLLTASDTPVDNLQVDPAARIYRLQTHPDATLTFVPGVSGAFDCAVRYRPLFDKVAAPGVLVKAGRFVFDVWGGKYAENTANLTRCFDYGLTNALVMIHTWQRWGYDYRLPDIFPPNPSLGTLEDLQQLGAACRQRGVLWGLHDNYIDIYPDADGFSYDHVTFTAEGKPRRAWLNESREAQSYQFRPDHIAPFLQRNLKLIVPALHPTASFVDVFSSMNSFDYFDGEGKLHSKRETQRAWGDAFVAIREACGNNSPTVSEAGSDHLIGWLDGADAQFMQLSDNPAPFHNAVSCRDWERVPWFDAVNHTRFSLHGVGYSERYQGGRSREEHGIESDDYLSAEILTGHALMIDRVAMGRGAVRKYWLAQGFIESVARDEIAKVEFAGGDIHHAIVTWNSGARVYVNRGDADWTVAGHVLPSFGFHAQNGDVACSVERIKGAVVEQSRGPGVSYVNSRVFAPAAPTPITPRAERVEYLGERKFRLVVNWEAQRPTQKDCVVFYHFSRATPGRRALTEFVGGGVPVVPTTRWHDRVVTGENWTVAIPETMPLGEYDVLVGLHDRQRSGERLRLQGDEDPRRRYRIGKLIISGTKTGGVTNVRLEQPAQPFVASARWLANAAAADFGIATTTGAFRCAVATDHAVITPLPDGDSFELQLRLREVFGRAVEVVSVQAVDKSGAVQSSVGVTHVGGDLSFTTDKSIFAYRINVR